MTTYDIESAVSDLKYLRETPPLVHHITNWVTISECASMTRCLGALPIMAHAPEEVEEMVNISDSLVLNIGTLTVELIDAMILAGKKANSQDKPVVLDAVGAGATKLRTQSTRKILDEVQITVIKGNAGEIATLAGAQAEVKGVESISHEGNSVDHARSLAKNAGCTVVVTGVEDIITNGRKTFIVKNGHSRMGEVVGTGCMAASVIGSFIAVTDDITQGAANAMCIYGIAGEKAGELAKGPGTMKEKMFDMVANLTPEDIREGANVDVQ